MIVWCKTGEENNILYWRDTAMTKSNKETKGNGTYFTNIKKDNTDELESTVINLSTGSWVYSPDFLWGKVVDVVTAESGQYIYVTFSGNKLAKRSYKVPDDFNIGKIRLHK